MATIRGCVHSHPTHRFSNSWKLLCIQQLIPAQKGICICSERESVYRQSSPVSGRRPPWWIMLPNNGSGLSQSEHAPIAVRHTNMLLFLPLTLPPELTLSPAKCGSTVCLYINKWVPQFLVKGKCGINGITHAKRPSVTACLWWQKRWAAVATSIFSNSLMKDGQDRRLERTVER